MRRGARPVQPCVAFPSPTPHHVVKHGPTRQADKLSSSYKSMFYLARTLGSSICSAIVCDDSCPRYENPGEGVPLRVHHDIFQNNGLHAWPLVFPLESFTDSTQHGVVHCRVTNKPGLPLDVHRDFIFRSTCSCSPNLR